MKIFLISPVRHLDALTQRMLAEYVSLLESIGHSVHWPMRDTNQVDETGCYNICMANFQSILAADAVHIWYDEASSGSKFDMGGLFMLVELLGMQKEIVIVNESRVSDTQAKSFFKVFQHLIDKRKSS